MAEIEKTINHKLDLTTFTIFGDVTPGEITSYLETNKSEIKTTRNLFDFRNATLASLSDDDIDFEVQIAKKFSRKGVKTAFVFPNYSEFKIGKMIKSLTETNGFASEIRVFNSTHIAKDWLLY